MRTELQCGTKEHGAALVVALLVAAVVSLLAVSVANDSLVSFRRVENQLHGQQAYALLLGAEGVARRVLLEDLEQSEIDSDTEFWGAEALEYPTDYGLIRGQLFDLSGRLNLANLVAQPTEKQRYNTDQQRFIRLLQVLPLEEPLNQNVAEQLANAVFDWLDADDNERSPGGAEYYAYSGAEPASRPANRVVTSVSEIRWVKGMTAEIYRALLPLLTVWPNGGSALNLNTANTEMLRSLNANNDLQPLLLADAEFIVEERQRVEGFEDLGIFTQDRFASADVDTANIGFSSTHFLLTSQTDFLSRTYRLRSVIRRDPGAGKIEIIARSQSGL